MTQGAKREGDRKLELRFLSLLSQKWLRDKTEESEDSEAFLICLKSMRDLLS